VDYLVRRATQCGAVAPTRSRRMLVALHEAMTNAVLHGNLGLSSALKEHGDGAFARTVAERCADPDFVRRVVDVEASFDGARAQWAFTDEGEGFDHEAALRRLDTEGPDLERLSGRVLVMIRAFMDEMHFEHGGRRIVLTMRQPAEERPRQPRVPVTRGVRVAPIGDDGAIDVTASREAVTRDISPGAGGLLQPPAGAPARVMITIPTENGAISLPAEVRHRQAVGDNAVEVGCRFEPPAAAGPPGPGPLSRLVKQLSKAALASADRRAAPQLPYTERIGVEVPGWPALLGFGRDVSRQGIAFFTTAELPRASSTSPCPSATAWSPSRSAPTSCAAPGWSRASTTWRRASFSSVQCSVFSVQSARGRLF